MMRRVRMLDLQAEFKLFEADVRAAIDRVLESQHFIGGPEIAEFEQRMCERLGTRHTIAVSNGTDALLCALMALGINRDDEVILPAFTFFATAGAVYRAGAKPVFVDIDPRTFNIDPERIESAVTPRTRAIMVVHLFGQCADMNAINAIARRHGLPVIEDAAQAIGATYHSKPACTLGDIACLSFYPTKNLGGFGEGGMVITNDDRLGTLARQLRSHGESRRYVHERVGANFRLDTMKAAILGIKLGFLDDFNARRRTNATLYDQLLADADVTTPLVADRCHHVYHQYSILSDRREELLGFLREHGIDSAVYYPVPLHLQECFAGLGYRRGDLPMTESVCDRILSIPVQPMLTEDDIRYVASCVAEFTKVGCNA
jgi:dTDP-4-amino-4,6-dideoxygalactose transaminase